MGRTFSVAVAACILVGAAAPSAPARDLAPRRYKVDFVEASWAIPLRAEGRYRLFSLESARFEDLESGEVMVFARSDRMECDGDEDGLSCGSGHGGFRTATGTPDVFEFADDLSSARVELEARGRSDAAEWAAEDPTEKPLDFFPYTFSRSEACPEGEGAGEGIYRRMRASGTVFGRDLDMDLERSFVGVGRYVLETECSPEGWWRSGLGLPRSARGDLRTLRPPT